MAAEQIDIIDLTCERDERELFRGLSCRLQAGEVLQVAGPNGAGKTSLLRILAGLMPAADGDVHYGGRSVLGGSGREHWRRSLLFLGHATAVKATLTAEENLAWLCALDQPVAPEAIWDALAAVGLRGYEDVPCRQMSAGQQRRVARPHGLAQHGGALRWRGCVCSTSRSGCWTNPSRRWIRPPYAHWNNRFWPLPIPAAPLC